MTHRTRVKICGITRAQDALLSEQLGADAIGFVFVRKSKRYVEPDVASAISHTLAPFITRVGLFLDDAPDVIAAVLQQFPSMVPQFHGQETPAQCERLFEQFGIPYIKAIGVGDGMPSKAMLNEFEHARAFLFDSNAPGQLGGTGHTFDWQQLDDYAGKPLVLAGGLNPDNVADAIKQIQPYAVDVSSGVEASKGIKNPAAMHDFFNAIHKADNDLRG